MSVNTKKYCLFRANLPFLHCRGEDFSKVVSLVKRIDALRVQLGDITRKIATYSDQRRGVVLKISHQQLSIFRELTSLLAQYKVPTRTDALEESDDDTRDTTGDNDSGTSNSDWEAVAHTLDKTTKKLNYHTPDLSLSNPMPILDTSNVIQGVEEKENTNDHFQNNIVTEKSNALSTVSGRSGAGPYYEIGPDDFLEVPSHIRGRCSLADVNKLLRTLQESHRKQQQNKISKCAKKSKNKTRQTTHQRTLWTLRSLESAGHKVSGQTGKCMLGVLQRLGLVEWARGRSVESETIFLSEVLCRDLATFM